MADRPEDIVAQERRRAPVAAATALIAGLLLIGQQLLDAATAADAPRVTLTEALGPLVNTGRPPDPPPALEVLRFIEANQVSILAGYLLGALAVVAMSLALAFLVRVARSRREDISRFLAPGVIGAGVALAVIQLAIGTIFVTRQAQLAGSAELNAAAIAGVRQGSALRVLGFVQVTATLAFAGGFVLASLNAMRVGLLTRLVGILGVAVAVLFVVGPVLLGTNPLVLQIFFFFALALLFRGRWPGGVPPAWVSGQAEPWPTQLELREARERAGAGAGDAPQSEPEHSSEQEATPVPAPIRPHSSSKKKKRKRR